MTIGVANQRINSELHRRRNTGVLRTDYLITPEKASMYSRVRDKLARLRDVADSSSGAAAKRCDGPPCRLQSSHYNGLKSKVGLLMIFGGAARAKNISSTVRRTRFCFALFALFLLVYFAVFQIQLFLAGNPAKLEWSSTLFFLRLPFQKAVSTYGTKFLGEIEFPLCFRAFLIPGYVWFLGVDPATFLKKDGVSVDFAAAEYSTMQRWFSRPLPTAEQVVRRETISANLAAGAGMVSPADGKLTAISLVELSPWVTVKGARYDVGTLVGESGLGLNLTEGKALHYAVIYLSPANYHRFHSPADFTIQKRQHFPGDVMPVKESVVHFFPQLHVVNERVVLKGEWSGDAHGAIARSGIASGDQLYYVIVAAMNVANIDLQRRPLAHRHGSGSTREVDAIEEEEVDDFDSDLMTGDPLATPAYLQRGLPAEKSYAAAIDARAGDQLGLFKLGSTIVLVFEGPKQLTWRKQVGDFVKMGDTLFTL